MPIPAHLKAQNKVKRDGSVTLVPDPLQQGGSRSQSGSGVTSLIVTIKKGSMSRIISHNSAGAVDNSEAPILVSPRQGRTEEDEATSSAGGGGEANSSEALTMVEQVALRFNLQSDTIFFAKPGTSNSEMIFEGDFVDGSTYVVGGESRFGGTGMGGGGLDGAGGSSSGMDFGPPLSVALGFCMEMQEHAPANPRIPEAPVRLQRAIEALGITVPSSNNAFTMSFPDAFKRVPTRKATFEEIGAVHLLSVYQPFLEGKLNFGSAFLEAEEAGILAKNGVAPTKVHSSMSQHQNSSCGGVLPTDVYWTEDSKSSQAVLYAAGITIEGARMVLRGTTSETQGKSSPQPSRPPGTGGEEVVMAPGGGSSGSLTGAATTASNSAFCLVRPPGHHCGHHTPNGFCLVNNVAVSLQDLRRNFPNKKLMVIDFDVHHGEGTQSLVESWNDSNISVISIHRYDEGRYFPHTGHLVQSSGGGGSGGGATGVAEIDDLLGGDGSIGGGLWYDRGLIMNIPFDTAPMDLSEGGFRIMSDYCFGLATQELILPALEKVSPDLVFFSAGFDASFGDPLGGMAVVNGFEIMVSAVAAWAKQPKLTTRTNLGGGGSAAAPRASLLAVLEGGYNPAKVAVGVQQVVKAMQYPDSINTVFQAEALASCRGSMTRLVPDSSAKWSPCCVTPPSWEGVRKKQHLKVEELAALQRRKEEGPVGDGGVQSPVANSIGEEQLGSPRSARKSNNNQPMTPGRPKASSEIMSIDDIKVRSDSELLIEHKQWAQETIAKVKKAHAGGPLA